MNAFAGIRANVLLCDAAQVVADKLYILGGGWSYMWLHQAEAPFGFMLAVDLVVPWDMANRSLPILTHIITEDHQEVTPHNLEEPIRIEGNIIAGRAPTARAGADLHVPFVLPFPPMVLDPGGYVCELVVDGEPLHRSPFQVAIAGQPL